MSNNVKQRVTQDNATESKRELAAPRLDTVSGLRRQVDSLFDEFFRDPILSLASSHEPRAYWSSESGPGSLAVDVIETEKSYEIIADLPGMTEKDVEVTLSHGNLIIQGEKKLERDEAKQTYHLSERWRGSFKRLFKLPKGVDAERIEANFSKSVMTITLPKTPESIKPEKVIKIKAS